MELGQTKILDFGLAKLTPARIAATDATVTILEPLTSPGTATGTPNYILPEQVRGEELDARTDLQPGAVLYEMATGRTPFLGRLERIVNKAMEKDRELRYQHAADLGADLKRLKRDRAPLQPMFRARLAADCWRLRPPRWC